MHDKGFSTGYNLEFCHRYSGDLNENKSIGFPSNKIMILPQEKVIRIQMSGIEWFYNEYNLLKSYIGGGICIGKDSHGNIYGKSEGSWSLSGESRENIVGLGGIAFDKDLEVGWDKVNSVHFVFAYSVWAPTGGNFELQLLGDDFESVFANSSGRIIKITRKENRGLYSGAEEGIVDFSFPGGITETLFRKRYISFQLNKEGFSNWVLSVSNEKKGCWNVVYRFKQELKGLYLHLIGVYLLSDPYLAIKTTESSHMLGPDITAFPYWYNRGPSFMYMDVSCGNVAENITIPLIVKLYSRDSSGRTIDIDYSLCSDTEDNDPGDPDKQICTMPDGGSCNFGTSPGGICNGFHAGGEIQHPQFPSLREGWGGGIYDGSCEELRRVISQKCKIAFEGNQHFDNPLRFIKRFAPSLLDKFHTGHFRCRTDGKGECHLCYISGPFSRMFKLIASTEVTTSSGEKKTLYARKRIIVRYPYLVKLSNNLLGTDFIGFYYHMDKMFHDAEYVKYANSRIVDRVGEFFEKLENINWNKLARDDSLKGIHPRIMLNDISLPMGGILKFVSGGESPTITKYQGHLSHRRGTGIDINPFICVSGSSSHYHQGRCSPGEYEVPIPVRKYKEAIKKICKGALHCKYVPEGSIHVEFNMEE